MNSVTVRSGPRHPVALPVLAAEMGHDAACGRAGQGMTGSWEQAYAACAPAPAMVLRAVATLSLEAVSSPAVGVAAGVGPDELAGCLAELVAAGWLVPAGEAHTVGERARAWLATHVAGQVEPERAAAIIRSFAEYHAAEVGRPDLEAVASWLRRHWAEVLAAIRACERTGLRRLGAGLALAVWPAAEPAWWDTLAGAGEALAIADRDPEMLADLLHRSAVRFAGHGDRLRAEEQWVRALAIIRRADKVDLRRGVAVRSGLSALYREWGRFGKALDADLAVVDLRREAGDPVDLALALSDVALTMRAAGRLSSAADYLAQADAVITGADGTPSLVVAHARILVRWGRTLWELGEPGAARRQWSRALAMLVDVDDEGADQVRELLKTAQGDPLPNTSSSSSGGTG